MENKKRLVIIVFAICLFYFQGYVHVNAMLGMTPALVETDFQPGLNFLVNYNVLGADSDQKLEVYADGDFAQYVKFDRTNFTGPQSFTAYITLPDYAKIPGRNKLFIRVREVKSITGGVGTRLEIGALILINVPYPGKYAQVKYFTANDANVGESVNYTLAVASLGEEDIYVAPKITVFSNGENIENITFDGRNIVSKNTEYFQKSSGLKYNAGLYNATAFIDNNGIPLEEYVNFRVGSLFVNITNWSNSFQRDKISKFYIGIESRWNSDIKNVYAEVNVTKDNSPVDFFKTPSIELKRWENGSLEGFFNSENLTKGNYAANITVFYEDSSTEKLTQIHVVNPPMNSKQLIIFIAIIAVILVLVAIILYLLFSNNKDKKKNKKKKKK